MVYWIFAFGIVGTCVLMVSDIPPVGCHPLDADQSCSQLTGATQEQIWRSPQENAQDADAAKSFFANWLAGEFEKKTTMGRCDDSTV